MASSREAFIENACFREVTRAVAASPVNACIKVERRACGGGLYCARASLSIVLAQLKNENKFEYQTVAIARTGDPSASSIFNGTQ